MLDHFPDEFSRAFLSVSAYDGLLIDPTLRTEFRAPENLLSRVYHFQPRTLLILLEALSINATPLVRLRRDALDLSGDSPLLAIDYPLPRSLSSPTKTCWVSVSDDVAALLQTQQQDLNEREVATPWMFPRKPPSNQALHTRLEWLQDQVVTYSRSLPSAALHGVDHQHLSQYLTAGRFQVDTVHRLFAAGWSTLEIADHLGLPYPPRPYRMPKPGWDRRSWAEAIIDRARGLGLI